ncbi:hypothetical protein GCM10022247_70760 [Allokutzneria multivorans]|uniref:Class I SAM-dependent methyltransferase n=1 Tax=Allokutzneria multivorans TaxID=1142134 RepID=A0ABP7U344_9PSEU
MPQPEGGLGSGGSWPYSLPVTSVRDGLAFQTGATEVFAEVAAAVLGPGRHRTVDLVDLLDGIVAVPVDVVRSGDDLLPRLAHDNALTAALTRACRSLAPGGLLIAAVPELDRLGPLRPTAPPPRVTGHGQDRQVTVQLWDWADDGSNYGLEVVQLVRGQAGWEVASSVSTRHQVLGAEDMERALAEAGFVAVQRLAPKDTGHPLPLWVAAAPR